MEQAPNNQPAVDQEALEEAAWMLTNGVTDSDVELAIEGFDPNDPLVSAVRAIMADR